MDNKKIFHNVKEDPFKVYGLYNYKNEANFKRLPDELAGSINNQGVQNLHTNTAGGRVRFSTNSKTISIKSIMPKQSNMVHMALTGSSGFDLYIDKDKKSVFYKTFMPNYDDKLGYESEIAFTTSKKRDITINFPLYNDVTELYIGLEKNSSIEEGAKYEEGKTVIFYGSSITQGGCASRPGNAYPSIISRRLNINHINFGFSGSAKGELALAQYMASKDSGIFVYDYDHNAPTLEHLEKTHEAFYLEYRKTNPSIPIVLVSRSDFYYNDVNENIKRRDIIYKTFTNGLANGDNNLYYIDGETLFEGVDRDSCTVDGCHPTDIGFLRMANVIGEKIKIILNK